MSMFTGLPPSIHSVEKRTNKLSKNIQTVTQLIKSKKYKTAAFVTLFFVSYKYGFSRGFDKFTEMFRKKADVVTDNALGWLKNNNKQPFFLFLHYCDVHWPYVPPTKYAEMFGVNTKNMRWRRWGRLQFLKKYSDPEIPMPKNVKNNALALYDGEIRSVDYNINRIIKYLKKKNIYNNTILVITSDHGEEFKEHNSFGHGHSLYSEVINVPLIIRFPSKIKSGLKIREPVITSDIPLTLLNMLKIKPPTQFKKYSLNLEKYFFKNAEKKSKNRQLMVETKSGGGGPKRFAIIKKGYKYFSPYKFQTRGKNKKWLKAPESVFNIFKDFKDLTNLNHTILSGEKLFFIKNNLKSSINRYIDKNVKGAQLMFFPSKDSSFKTIMYKGYIQFDHEIGEVPFGVNFSDIDSLDAEDNDGKFYYTIYVKSSTKKIYLPNLNIDKRICINIRQNGNLIFRKSIIPPKTNKSLILVPESNYNGNIFIKGSIPGVLSEKVSISDKEKKLLKTLGYI